MRALAMWKSLCCAWKSICADLFKSRLAKDMQAKLAEPKKTF